MPAADGFDIVVSAIHVIGNDRTRCEFAINVGSTFGGAGLARTLMTALIEPAAKRAAPRTLA